MDLHYVDKSCLYSTVKNISGKQMVFSFLPDHGTTLGINEEYTVFGDIIDRLKTRRQQQALASALDNGFLTIVQTPSPVFTDTGTGHVKVFTLHNGVISAIDPCWDSSDSLEATIPA